MRITLDVPDHKAAFLLELLRSLPFVTLRGHAAKVEILDATAHLLSSPANATRLRAALERSRLGQYETHSLPELI